MPFKFIKHVVSHFLKKFGCQQCAKKFREESIFVADTKSSPQLLSIFLIAICPGCAAPTLAVANLIGLAETGMYEGGISINEVLDMHNFLKNWNGGMKDLFKK